MKDAFQPLAPPQIPDHELLRRIGQGSYGEIWLAKNIVGTYRAVKIVYRANFAEARPYAREFEGIKKFEPISRSHPGLVHVLQIGRKDDDGYFYYVMELADDEVTRSFDPNTYSARTLDKELATRARLPAEESLKIGRNLAAALAHMHRQGLVHRDIKPSNIIFVNGEPKLADIGLVVSVSDATHTFVGTEGYVPPEGPGTVQADIFSLGKVLYEISTGQDRTFFPELPDDLNEFPDSELIAELNEVVVKACATSPTARYTNTDDLVGDLEMLLVGRSVRRLHLIERRLKRVKRLAVAASLLAIAAIIFGSVVNELRQRQKTLLAQSYVTAGARMVEDGNYHGSLPLFAEAARLEKHDCVAVEAQRARVGSVLQQSPRLLQFFQADTNLSDVHFSPDGEQLLLAGARHARLLNIETGIASLDVETKRSIETALFSPDGRHVAIANGSVVTVVDVAARTNISFRLPDHVNSAEFSPHGEMILVACRNQCARLIDAQTGKTLGDDFTGHTDEIFYAAFSPDGSMIVTASRDGTARIWDTASRQTLQTLPHPKHWVHDAAFSPDGLRVVTAVSDRTLRLWNVTNGSPISARMEHRSEVRRARFSPDGRFIVSAGWDRTVRFWDGHTGDPTGALLNLHTAAMQAVFDNDSRRVVVAGFAGEIKVWHLLPDAPVAVGSALMSKDGERYVTFSSNTFRVWNARDDSPLTASQNVPGTIVARLCSRTAERVLVQTPGEDASKLVHVFDWARNTSNSFSIPGSGRRWWLNDDGTKLVTANNREVYLWDTASGKLIFGPGEFDLMIEKVAFSPDGRALALAGDNSKLVFLLNAANGEQLLPPLRHERSVGALAFSYDSARLLSGTSTADLAPCVAQIWDTRTGQRIGPPLSHADGLESVCFSHDGKLVATSGEDQRVRVWKAATGEEMMEPISLIAQAHSVEFSADDRWLITATWYGAQVWNTRKGHPVTPAFVDKSVFETAGFCSDGRRIWVQSWRGLLFWNLPRDTNDPDEWIALADQFGVTIPSGVHWNHDALTVAQLRERCAAERSHLRANLASWQRTQAQLSEANKDWFAAQFYLEQLLKKAPDDPTLRERLDHAEAQLLHTPMLTPVAQDKSTP